MEFVPNLELMLFEGSPEGTCTALQHGISNFMLDWEHMGKLDRQAGFDTEIAPVDVQSLAAVAAAPGRPGVVPHQSLWAIHSRRNRVRGWRRCVWSFFADGRVAERG
ncbi:MAG: hypothetical protein MZV65_16485 [Chromatiales bacterium]|nr:hypothetical protein [Chromatiales bacterium]